MLRWRHKAYLPLNAFEAFDGSQLGAALHSKVFTPASMETTTLYDRACSMDKVVQLWNSTPAGLINWQGHGLDDYTEKVMQTSLTPQLSAEYPAHVWMISCHNGKPKNPQNLGYNVLKHSAISTVSSSVQVLYSANMKELGTSATTRHWAYMYDVGLVLDSLSSGAAMAQSRSTITMRFDSDWLNASEMNLYGCPNVGLYSHGVTGTALLSSAESVSVQPLSASMQGGVLSVEGVADGSSLRLLSLLGRELWRGEKRGAVAVPAFSTGVFVLEVNGTTALPLFVE